MALAIGAGSVFFCHVNDAGFWMVREYFGLQLKHTVMVWSVLADDRIDRLPRVDDRAVERVDVSTARATASSI